MKQQILLIHTLLLITATNVSANMIVCDGEDCVNRKVTCARDEPCRVQCLSRHSCDNTEIICASGEECTVSCSNLNEETVCIDVTISGSTASHLTVEAGGFYKSLLQSKIQCPAEGVCDINCYGNHACEVTEINGFNVNFHGLGPKAADRVVINGADNGKINIHCDANVEFPNIWTKDVCRDLIVNVENADSLYVIIDGGIKSLRFGEIHCPLSGDCSILINVDHASSEYSIIQHGMIYLGEMPIEIGCVAVTEFANSTKTGCIYNTTLIANNGQKCELIEDKITGDLSCMDSNQYLNSMIKSLQIPANLIVCDGDNCANTQVICERDQPCNVQCRSKHSCNNTEIICASGEDCTVSCTNLYEETVCIDVTIFGGTASHLTVDAGGFYKSLFQSKILCPDAGECDINCYGNHACEGTEINGLNVNFHAVGHKAAFKLVINSADNGKINIHCDANVDSKFQATKDVCRDLIVNVENADSLYAIIDEGFKTLYFAKIHCPRLGECIILMNVGHAASEEYSIIKSGMIYLGEMPIEMNCVALTKFGDAIKSGCIYNTTLIGNNGEKCELTGDKITGNVMCVDNNQYLNSRIKNLRVETSNSKSSGGDMKSYVVVIIVLCCCMLLAIGFGVFCHYKTKILQERVKENQIVPSVPVC